MPETAPAFPAAITSERVTPATLDPATLPGFEILSGSVRATDVGEWGDLLLMGHHDDATALALKAEHRRHYDGEELTDDDLAVYTVERRYASFSDHSEACEKATCSCLADEVCAACISGSHDACPGDHECECAGGYDHEATTTWLCGCECWCDEYAWWVEEAHTGHEVTWVRWVPARL